jgi:hypothetical protein
VIRLRNYGSWRRPDVTIRIGPWTYYGGMFRNGSRWFPGWHRWVANPAAKEGRVSAPVANLRAATPDFSRLTPRELAAAVTPLFILEHRFQREALNELVIRCEAALANPAAEEGVRCDGHYCGDLDWTVKHYGRITHKHACPVRTDPYCQTHARCLPRADSGGER